ncbi:MAG: 3-oxoacyl-ACP synthase III family protein [Alphaproteobacteria bacterium]
MVQARVDGVRIAGLTAGVPDRVVRNDSLELFSEDDRRRLIETTGIEERRHIHPGMCTSDMCAGAAEALIADTGVPREEIGLVVFVSQTPDYPLPATSTVLQARLGLTRNCAAFDVSLGCSGYTYGLWQAAHLLRSLDTRYALLLVGEVGTHQVSVEDRATAALFGDCGTATLLEKDPDAPEMIFDLGTDGRGRDHLIIPAGQCRYPFSEAAARRRVHADGSVRADMELFMDGPQVFVFTLREVPRSLEAARKAAGWAYTGPDAVDGIVLHQANKFMIDYIAKRCKLPTDRMKYSIERFGNTSSASLPLTLVAAMAADLAERPCRLLLSGFGVGWSWASAAVTLGPIPAPRLIELGPEAVEAPVHATLAESEAA